MPKSSKIIINFNWLTLVPNPVLLLKYITNFNFILILSFKSDLISLKLNHSICSQNKLNLNVKIKSIINSSNLILTSIKNPVFLWEEKQAMILQDKINICRVLMLKFIILTENSYLKIWDQLMGNLFFII